MNRAALAAFFASPDSEIIVDTLDKLQPEIRKMWVGNLLTLAGVNTPQPTQTAGNLRGEFPDTRCVERRLQGESIADIASAEGLTPSQVKSYLREAQKAGVDVSISDGAPASRKIAKRRNHPKKVREYSFAQRMAGCPPSMIVRMLKRDLNYDVAVYMVNRFITESKVKHGVELPPLSALETRHAGDANHPMPAAATYPWSPQTGADNLIHLAR